MSTQPDKERPSSEKGMSLLQGLAILAVIGIVGAAIARYFAG